MACRPRPAPRRRSAPGRTTRIAPSRDTANPRAPRRSGCAAPRRRSPRPVRRRARTCHRGGTRRRPAPPWSAGNPRARRSRPSRSAMPGSCGPT
ncbi:hypothetical protein CIW52_12410 [Mycolicibacterium sp. P9-64]|nr:hypothetical protein CIW52_12410 [Mycolicibacterium sp. P9-64]